MHDLHDHIAFRSIVLTGGFNAAARQLSQTPATLSRRIIRLEEALGVRLFHRTTRSLGLTTEGRMYLDMVAPAIDAILASAGVIADLNGQPRGIVRILMASIIARTIFLPALPAFLDAYPEIKVEIVSSELGNDLVKENIDIALHYGPHLDSNYISRVLAKAPVYLMASFRYVEKWGIPRTVADLVDHNCINGQFIGGPVVWQLMQDGGDGRNGEITYHPKGNVFLMNNFSLALDAALEGIGITLCDYISGWRLLEQEALKILLPDYRVIGNEDGASVLNMSYPDKEFMPLRVKLMKNFLIETFETSQRAPFDPHAFAW